MLISVPKSLKLIGIFATIITLSACSSMPRVDGGGLGESVGNTVSTVTEKTRELGSIAYQSTRRFLGYDREPRQAQDGLIEDVDLALMDDDVIPVNNDDGVNVVVIQPVEVAESSEALPLDTGAATSPTEEIIVSDYVHEVMPGESLWTIAKATTGDATNWRLLAEYNEMTEGASVFPTQKLVIPADMVKPEIAGLQFVDPASNESQIAAIAETGDSVSDNELIIADNTTEEESPARLKLPELDVTETIAEAAIEEEPAERIVSAANAVPVTVEAGETLWDLSKRSTGDATNWKQIAAHNNFSEEEAVFIRYGQTIYIPNTMAKDEVLAQAGIAPEAIAKEEPAGEVVAVAEEAPTEAKLPAEETLAAATTEEAIATEEPLVVSAAIEASANAITDASVFDETKPIKIVEATFQSEDKLPLGTSDETTAAQANTESGAETIMVSGTYYPKAIYNEADFSSSLLQRVSPGTELIVSRSMGSWYEVQTDKGLGYMHARDIK